MSVSRRQVYLCRVRLSTSARRDHQNVRQSPLRSVSSRLAATPASCFGLEASGDRTRPNRTTVTMMLSTYYARAWGAAFARVGTSCTGGCGKWTDYDVWRDGPSPRLGRRHVSAMALSELPAAETAVGPRGTRLRVAALRGREARPHVLPWHFHVSRCTPCARRPVADFVLAPQGQPSLSCS